MGELVDAACSSSRRRLGGRRHDPGLRDAGHRARGARCADRSLPAPEKAALQAAAVDRPRVLGRPRSSICSEATSRTSAARGARLHHCARARRAGEDREFAIKHALTREVAYASIPKARRGRLHAALADWLARSGSRRARARPRVPLRGGGEGRGRGSRLGRRRRRARRASARAPSHWLARAGRLARGRYEIEEAVELFDARGRAVDGRARTRAPLARDRRGAGAPVRRRGMRKALLSALEGPLDDAGARGRLRAPRVPDVDSLGDVVDPPDMELIEEWAIAGARARGGRERGECAGASRAGQRRAARCSGGRTRGGRRARGGARQPRAPLVRARCANAGAPSTAALPRGGGLSEQRLALLPGIDDPDHLCEAYESGSPAAAAVCRFDEARRLAELHARPLAAALASPPRPLGLARAGARGRARRLGRRWLRRRIARGRRSRRTSPRRACATLATFSSCGLAHLCLGRRVAGERARADGLRSRRGVRDLPERARLRIALVRGDRARPSARRASRGARARLGPGDLRCAARRASRTRATRPDRA